MNEPPDESPVIQNDEAEIKELLGLFDAPAFARRGSDLERALTRLGDRLERERGAMLEMVRLRLKQWSGVASGPADWCDVFMEPVDRLFLQTGADPPQWASIPAPVRKRQTVARDLAASVTRFNRRWLQFLDHLKLDAVNTQIDHYNRYYILEKECVLGSARLAARHFISRSPLTRDRLLIDHPLLDVPALRE